MKRNTTKKTALVILGATSIAFVLAACSTGGDGAKPTASPSPTTKAAAVEYGKCIDGHLTVFANETAEDGAVPVDACAAVSIVGTAKAGVTYKVGKTDRLVVEGTGLTVAAESAPKIVIPGNDNTITHTGPAEVTDLGSGNTVSKR